MLPYEADTVWNRGIPCICFKTLIQLYLLRSSLYSWTYFIKEVIKGKICWKFDLKVLAYKAATARNRWISCNFFKTLIQLYLFYLFLYFLTYCIKEGIEGNIFWTLNLKVLAYEASTAWNRGIPCNFSKQWSNCIFFVSCFIVLLNA